MYKILIISVIIFLINEYFFKDKLLNFIGIMQKYFKTFLIILAIVAIYYTIQKEESMVGKLNTLSKINLNNPIKHISELFDNNITINSKDSKENIKDLNENKDKNYNSDNSNRYKRSVSETKKKVVAYNQDWKCDSCQKKLPASFEVHHKLSLQSGGSNDIDNLVALCRNCHGNETIKELIKN